MKLLIIFLIAVIAPTCMGVTGGNCYTCDDTDPKCQNPDGGAPTPCDNMCVTIGMGPQTKRTCDSTQQTKDDCEKATKDSICCDSAVVPPKCNHPPPAPTSKPSGGGGGTEAPAGDTSSNVRPEFILSIGAALWAMGFTISI